MWEYHDPYHPAADELYHFKYIKRVQGPNGKWQYTYDRGALKTDVNKTATQARRSLAMTRAKVNTARWHAKKNLNERVRKAKVAADNFSYVARRGMQDKREKIRSKLEDIDELRYRATDRASEGFKNVLRKADRATTKAKRKYNTAKFIAGRRINSTKRAISNRINAKIATAVQKRARRRKGWNG